MRKVFLSHSSKDKNYVRLVADTLGSSQIEYDEKTFDFNFNVKEIRDALRRCDLFVYFLSRQSITSNFIAEEHRAALEARGAGALAQVLVFCIDDTSYKDLPVWMQEINTVQSLKSPLSCARHIQAALLELGANDERDTGYYFGRDEDEAILRRAVIVPKAMTPTYVHVVGYHGIGRRTFISNSLKRFFPRIYKVHVEITIGQFEGPNEFYRHLFALTKVASKAETSDAFRRFSALSVKDQAQEISEVLIEMSENGEFLFVIDEGGVFSELGELAPYLALLKDLLSFLGRPVIFFIQTRMMPFRFQTEQKNSHFQYIKPLKDEYINQILALSLQEFNIDFTEDQIKSIALLVDGHPYNIKFAMRYMANFGIQMIIDDPTELIEWKNKRAVDFLGKIEFSDLESNILSVVSDYHYISSQALIEAMQVDDQLLNQAVRRLQEFCCIERRDSYFHIAPPIRDGVKRDIRFHRSSDWLQEIGRRVCDMVSNYTSEDHIPVSIIENATIAAARSKHPPEFLASLILPSHLLRVAKEAYDAGRRGLCIELCEKVWASRDRLPIDAHVEILRLWGLSAIRVGNGILFQTILTHIRALKGPVANRTRFFLEGFEARLRNDLDTAESRFLAAWKMSKNNQSFNRELASLYCKQKRFSEAETFSRKAYEQNPTNPFIIDIMAETLIGKQSMGLQVNKIEIDEIISQLQIYGDAPGSSFYLVREAQSLIRKGDKPGAMASLNRAVDRTPSLIAPYFIRAELYISLKDTDSASADLKTINKILEDAGGFSEGDEAKSQEIDILIAIERGSFKIAREKITDSAFLSTSMKERLLTSLANTISFNPTTADVEMREWAKTGGIYEQSSPRKNRNGRRGRG